MPTNLTDVSTFSAPIAVPAAGEARTAASVQTPFQLLANRTRFVHDALMHGALVRPPSLVSTNGTQLTIGPISRVLIGGVALSLSTATTLSPSLSANLWQYVYCYNNAGAVAFETSGTAPDAALAFKSGDTSRVYLGCYLSNAAAQIVPFSARAGHYVYRLSALAPGAFQTNNASSSGARVDLPLIGGTSTLKLLPPHARVVTLRLRGQSVSGASGTVFTWTETDPNSDADLSVPSGGNTYDSRTFVVGATQVLQYQSPANVLLHTHVVGFEE